jgi:WD40 repeat protein
MIHRVGHLLPSECAVSLPNRPHFDATRFNASATAESTNAATTTTITSLPFIAVASGHDFLLYDLTETRTLTHRSPPAAEYLSAGSSAPSLPLLMHCKEAHDSEITSMITLYAGTCLVTCGRDARIRLWHLDLVHQAAMHLATVTADPAVLGPDAFLLHHRPHQHAHTHRSVASSDAAAAMTHSHTSRSASESAIDHSFKLSSLAALDDSFIAELPGHSDTVNVLLKLNETSFASCGADGLVVLFKVGFQLILRFFFPLPLMTSIHALVFV